MSFRVADRIRNLPNYPFVEISAEVRTLKAQGKDVIVMNMGSPDLSPPAHVIESLARSAAKPNTHGYAGYRGIPAFREAVARYYKKTFNIDLNPETEVLPLLGSKEGLANLALALISAGDVSLVPSPAYPVYEMSTLLAQGDNFFLPLTKENHFLPDLNSVPEDIAQRARILWVNYPNNPTGALASKDDYKKMIDFCARYNILLASDNPYMAIVFDGEPVSALQADPDKKQTVEFMSFSKTYGMAGWRLGAAVGNSEVLEALLRIKSNVDSGHFTAIYDAGITAIDETPQSWVDERNDIYASRAQILIEAAPSIGLIVDQAPRGSIYVWLRVEEGSDVDYCKGALHQAGVSIVPGSVYGEAGAGYVRFSLVMPEETIRRAISQLQAWWSSR